VPHPKQEPKAAAKHSKERPKAYPSAEDVREIVHYSGYPLEMRTVRALQEAGVSAAHGQRVRLPNGDSREVDVVGQLTTGESCPGTARFVLMLQTKVFHAPRTFVGFYLHDRMPAISPLRCRLAGVPTWPIREGDVRPTGLFEADGAEQSFLDVLNPSHVCVQWGVAEHHNQLGMQLQHLDSVYDDLESLARCSRALRMRARRRAVVRNDVPTSPDFSVFFPTLVLAAPSLYVVDVAENVQAVEWCTLVLQMDLDGFREQTAIDVVTEAALPRLLARHKTALASLEARIRENAEPWNQWSIERWKELQERDLSRLAAAT
jgi:hypothetical protein